MPLVEREDGVSLYWEESGEKLPATKSMHPPAFIRKALGWYYMRIYVKVRPERVYVWPRVAQASRRGRGRTRWSRTWPT